LKMEKVKESKKGSKKYTYWMASWREGDRVRNVHLGSSKKLSRADAAEKARKLKAEALRLLACDAKVHATACLFLK
jgi:hypothetical protein